MIEILTETGSTNEDLADRIRAGEPIAEGFWLRADRQTGGRGRQGRAWLSPNGNLHASTVVLPGASDPAAHTLALVTGLAVHDALAERGADPMLKWPNDVLIAKSKIAGMLLERVGDAVVIGIGVNVVSAPGIPGRLVTCLAECLPAPIPGANELLARIASTMERRVRQWRATGLAGTLREWQERAHPAGAPLSVHLDGGIPIKGAFAGLAADGALRLRLACGEVREVHAGDVSLV